MFGVRITKFHIIFLYLVLAFVIILSTDALAATYGFKCITNNVSADATTGETQLFLDVTDRISSGSL